MTLLRLIVIPAIYPMVKRAEIRLTAGDCGGRDMMDNMMHMMPGMGWGMGLVSLLIIVLVILAIAALVKYVFFK